MAFYVWLILGVVLLGLELFIPGVILVFFGIGAVLTALLLFIFNMSLGLQIFIFLAASILSLVLFRKKFLSKWTKEDKKIEFDNIIGEKVIVVKTIPKGLTGKVELHGSQWSAEAQRDDIEIAEGTWVIVRGRNNLKLIVEPLKS